MKEGFLNQQEQMPQEQVEQPDNEQQQPPSDDQDQFDILMANAMTILYDEKVAAGIVESVASAQNAVEAIAKATLDIFARLEVSAEQNNIQIKDGVKIQGANHIMGEIMTMVEQAGGPQLNEPQRTEAYNFAVSMYLDNAVKSGKMSPEELMALSQEIQQTPDGQQMAQGMGQAQQQMQGQPQQGGPQNVSQ